MHKNKKIYKIKSFANDNAIIPRCILENMQYLSKIKNIRKNDLRMKYESYQ